MPWFTQTSDLWKTVSNPGQNVLVFVWTNYSYDWLYLWLFQFLSLNITPLIPHDHIQRLFLRTLQVLTPWQEVKLKIPLALVLKNIKEYLLVVSYCNNITGIKSSNKICEPNKLYFFIRRKYGFDLIAIVPLHVCYSRSQWPRGLKAYACKSSPAEIVGSNHTGGHGCLSVVSVVCWSLWRADQLSRGVRPTVVCRCVWSRNVVNEKALAHWGIGGAIAPKTNIRVTCFGL